MKTDEFKKRFNEAITSRNMKPIELSQKTGLSKSTISHYMSGYAKPKSDKLYILAKALEVNEAWLMGLDVPMNRSEMNNYHISLDTIAFEITGRSLQYSPIIFDTLCKSLDDAHANNVLEILRNPSISYDDKAYALRSIMEIVLYDMKEKHLNIYYTFENNELNNLEISLQRISNKLNITGLAKVLDYATDLSNMDVYAKQPHTDCQLAAAHARTDITPTPEGQAHDNAIMEDESEWE